MPYRVLVDEVAVLHKIGEMTDHLGNVIADEHETLIWSKDELIPDDKVAPAVVAKYEDGDEHTCSLLSYEAERPTRRGRPPKSEAGNEETTEEAA